MSAGRPAQTFPTSDALTAAWRRIATSSRSLYQMGSASLWSKWRPKTTTKSTGDSWRQQNQHALLTPTAQLETLKRGKATKRITYDVGSKDELTAAGMTWLPAPTARRGRSTTAKFSDVVTASKSVVAITQVRRAAIRRR